VSERLENAGVRTRLSSTSEPFSERLRQTNMSKIIHTHWETSERTEKIRDGTSQTENGQIVSRHGQGIRGQTQWRIYGGWGDVEDRSPP